MTRNRLTFQVTALAAECASVPIEWQGRETPSGPLHIALDENAPANENRGVLDYASRRAEVTFHVKLAFPELAEMLQQLGVESALSAPVRAILRSEGEILEDHSFALAGRCELKPHAMFSGPDTAAAVLPGH